MSFFQDVAQLPEDPIFNLTALFKKDTCPQKVNLGVGAYQDAEGKPYVLMCVRRLEEELVRKKLSKDYLPIQGSPDYIEESLKLIFGADAPFDRIFGAQTIGGTGALRVGGEYLSQHFKKPIYISDPSWANHRLTFTRAGFKVETYRYYDRAERRIAFDSMCSDLSNLAQGSVILLHACCHNPSGMDLSREQWKELSELIKKKGLFPFFDMAYQGFSKDIEEDAWPIRYFVSEGHELTVSSSYAKNMGIYGERAGVLSFVFRDSGVAASVGTHIKQYIRGNYSNPTLQAARIVSGILKTPELRTMWLHELKNMRERINEIREAFALGLQSKTNKADFAFMRNQKGMFSYTGLNQEQVQLLQTEKAIYMTADGRINVAGLNPINIDYVVDSITSIVNR